MEELESQFLEGKYNPLSNSEVPSSTTTVVEETTKTTGREKAAMTTERKKAATTTGTKKAATTTGGKKRKSGVHDKENQPAKRKKTEKDSGMVYIKVLIAGSCRAFGYIMHVLLHWNMSVIVLRT